MKTGTLVKKAFMVTIPVLTGYLFLGAAWGILMHSQGHGLPLAVLMSTTIYAGSLQYVAVGLLGGPFNPVNVLMITLLVNARHIFYGVSMLDKFKGFGKLKPYMIFSLTDETFSLLYATKAPEGADEKRFAFCIAVLDQLYWIVGGALGVLLGGSIPFEVEGIEFVMTALFVTILVEQLRQKENRIPAVVGLAGAGLCLALFGAGAFMLPAMVLLVVVLAVMRPTLEKEVPA